MKATNFLFLSFCLFLFSCGESTMGTEGVLKYATNPSNGLVKSKQVAWLQMDAFFKPSVYMVAKEISRNRETPSEDYSSLIAAYDEMYYFDLRLSTPGTPGVNIETYGITEDWSHKQRLQYLSFSMKDDLYLLQNGKKIPCELFHFERNYSLSPHRTFICGFPKTADATKGNLTLVFDSEYLQTGPLKLVFSARDIANSPLIDIAQH